MAEATPALWDADRVARWLKQAEGIDRQLQPVSDVLFAAAALQPGEAVLDVGCGTGPTTRDAATAVGLDGRVIGLDVMAEMLARAATEPVPAGAAPIEWLQADPVEGVPGTTGYDVVLSRFGVMFFSDPPAAFEHLASATKPGGRLVVATWAPRADSALFEVPYQAALAALGKPDDFPGEEGPFSLGVPDQVVALLDGAGWADARPVAHRLSLPFGGGVDVATAAEAALDFGATRLAVSGADDEARARVVEAIAEAFEHHLDAEGHVVLDGTVLVTTARRSLPAR